MLEFKDFSLIAPMQLHVGDMRINAGQMVGLAGASGSGKSSILRAVAGEHAKAKGELLWDGQRFDREEPAKRPVSILFQAHNLFMHLTIRQNIALGLQTDLRLSQAEQERIDDMAQSLGIFDQLEKFPRQCSGGQAARAALARIILQARPIVLFDEAFASLGPAQREEIRGIIDEKLIQKGRLVIFSSHQTDALRDWSDEILWLDAGRLNPPEKTTHFFVNAPKSAKTYFGRDFERFR